MEYCRLVLFMAGVLLGVQVPSFVQDYEQNLSARLSESDLSLREFQNDADKFFAGDIQALIQHYRNQQDAVISDGADNISVLYERNQSLKQASTTFHQTFFSPYMQTFMSPLPDVRSDVWKAYDYSIVLNAKGIAWGLAAGLSLAAVIELTLMLFGGIGGLLFGRSAKQRRRPYGDPSL